jgi:GTP cyclohydrolase I
VTEVVAEAVREERPSRLSVVRSRSAVDRPAAERAVTDLLRALGRDPDDPHLAETPRRVADSYAELLTPWEFELTTFPNDEGYDELVMARDLQVQERLTQQIADWLQENLAPRGVGVVLEAEHLCMSLRGVRARGARTTTSALHGLLREDPRSRTEFLALTRAGG